MLIRELKSGDSKELRRLLGEYLKETSALGGDMAYTRENVDTLLTLSMVRGSVTTVADSGRLYGFSLTTPTTFDHTAGMASMGLGTYVDVDYRRLGYGKALRTLAYSLLYRRGYHYLIGSVSDRNEGAIVSAKKDGGVAYGQQLIFELKGF